MSTFVFLHGLLGSKEDWQNVIEKLPHFHCIALDLPLHGEAIDYEVTNFSQTCQYLEQQLQQKVGDQSFYLVGYSLGGRIALYYALEYLTSAAWQPHLKGLILEGANLGLSSLEEKQARWQQDQQWATRFAKEPAHLVLNDWYQQAVFSHLKQAERDILIEKRIKYCGKNISQMLNATSLEKQPDLKQRAQTFALPIYYFCGEYDVKFKHIALESKLNLILIKGAGHNAHSEQPEIFASQLEKLFEI
ncbi:2-succinyl-6-hydroxy-2,4-cyclohexadiene-1-carboxylate synthase [Bisgaard Taxon 46]